MGPTGSGKTSVGEETARFDSLAINVAYANHQRVSSWLFRQCVFVDTPGFDGTYRSDRDILRMIAEWWHHLHSSHNR